MLIKPKPVKVLLFDLGKVVINIDFRQVFLAWSQSSGVDINTIASRFSFIDDDYTLHENGVLDISEFYVRQSGKLRMSISKQSFIDGWNQVFIGPVPGIERLIKMLAKKFPLYCFSNTNKTHEIFWRENYADILSYFRHIYTSCNLGYRKPEVDSYKLVCDYIDIPPNQVLFFDDSQENIEGASKAGLKTCLVISNNDIENALRQFDLFPEIDN